jgi:putative salt-induced outer membrane protein YdiY
MKTDGMIFVALIVIILMGAFILVQQNTIQKTNINNLPDCDYSMVINMQGQGHYGYWVQTGPTGENECITRMNDRGTVVDQGL